MTGRAAVAGDPLVIANRIADAHWHPEGAPWSPVCARCTDTQCPAYDAAMAYLMRLRSRLLTVGTATYGRH